MAEAVREALQSVDNMLRITRQEAPRTYGKHTPAEVFASIYKAAKAEGYSVPQARVVEWVNAYESDYAKLERSEEVTLWGAHNAITQASRDAGWWTDVSQQEEEIGGAVLYTRLAAGF